MDKGAFLLGLYISGAHDDRASSRRSLLTSGRDATSKKTLQEASSRSAPRTAVIRAVRLAAGDFVAWDLLVRVFVPDGFQLVIRGGREHEVELSGDRRQVWELVARVELQDGSLWRTHTNVDTSGIFLKCCTMMEMKSSRICWSCCQMTDCVLHFASWTLTAGCAAPPTKTRGWPIWIVFFVFLDDN